MRHRYAALAAFPFLAACSAGDTTAPRSSPISSLALAASHRAEAPRPAGGRCDTDISFLPPQAGDPANYLRLHIEFICQLRHMGRTTASVEQLVIFTGPTTAVASNTATYTAANGDLLYATWSGTSTNAGPDIVFSGEETITGGTGRFAGATGSTWVTGTASFVTNRGQFTSAGWITY